MGSFTDIKICSNAMTRLAADPFSSFSEDDAGIVCAENYPTIKAGLLSRYPWRISMRMKKLQRDSTAPVAKWTYSHQVPNDALDEYGAIRGIFPSASPGARPINDFEIFGKFIFCNYQEIWAEYQVDVDESDFPPYLVELMTLAVCAELAEPVTDQTSKVTTWEAKAYGLPGEQRRGGYFRIAAGLDAQQSPIQETEDYEFIDVRF